MAFRKREYMSSASICNSKMQRSTWHPMGCKFHSNLLFKTSKKESLIPPILNPNPIPNPIPSSNLFVKSHHHHPHLPTPILYHHFCWNPIKITKWLKSSIPLPNPILNRGKGQNFCGRTGSVSSGSFPRVDFCGSRSGWFPIQLLQFFFLKHIPGLVHKEAGPHAFLQRLAQHRLGLHGAALDAVHHHHGAIGDAQGRGDLTTITWHDKAERMILNYTI